MSYDIVTADQITGGAKYTVMAYCDDPACRCMDTYPGRTLASHADAFDAVAAMRMVPTGYAVEIRKIAE